MNKKLDDLLSKILDENTSLEECGELLGTLSKPDIIRVAKHIILDRDTGWNSVPSNLSNKRFDKVYKFARRYDRITPRDRPPGKVATMVRKHCNRNRKLFHAIPSQPAIKEYIKGIRKPNIKSIIASKHL